MTMEPRVTMISDDQRSKLTVYSKQLADLEWRYQEAKVSGSLYRCIEIHKQINAVKDLIDEIKQGIKVDWRFHDADCECDDCLRAIDAYLGN